PGQWIANLAISVDGNRVLSALDALNPWDFDFIEKERSWGAHAAAVTSGAFSGDGRVLATGGQEGGVKLWDVSNGELLASLEGHKNTVRGLVFLSDNQT